MASHYWIKLYQEMLRDPKVGRLSDGAYRRFIELLLMAGENDPRDGSLPCVDDIAWQLRVGDETLTGNLKELENAGIIEMRGPCPFLVNFEKRQGAMSAAEKQRRYRERKALQDHYEPDNQSVTDVVTNGNAETETETETETELDEAAAAIFTAYGDNIGEITYKLNEIIQAAINEYPHQWILDAIDEAVTHNGRSWAYIDAILKRWKKEGRQKEKLNGHHPDSAEVAWGEIFDGSKWTAPQDERAKRAVNSTGGWTKYKATTENQLPFLKKDFINAYKNAR